MADDDKNIATGQLQELLLNYKYLSALRKITNGVTHQYNNIFTGLSGQLRTRKQEADGDGVSERRTLMLEDLLRRGMEQTEILYDFSREGDSCPKAYAPQRLAGKAIDLLNTVSRMHRFSLQIAEDLPKIKVRQRDIVLMLFYLGENAIAAMREGGEIQLEISSSTSARDCGAVRFCLVDTGTGVMNRAEIRDADPFYFTRDAGTFAGIGLYAVRTIAAEYGGTFTLAEGPGGGAVAVVEIPVMANAQAKGIHETGKCSADRLGAMAQLPSRPQKHVFLVVDDEEAMRDLIGKRLQRRNHVAFCVESCREAIREFRLRADSVSVVLIDVGLRDADGYECARRLRRIDEKVRIILMSGMDPDPKNLVEIRAAFLKKPFPIEQLEQLVDNVSL